MDRPCLDAPLSATRNLGNSYLSTDVQISTNIFKLWADFSVAWNWRNLNGRWCKLSLWVLKWSVKVAQSYPTLYNPMDYTIHRILQARILEWVVFPFSRVSSQPRDQTWVSGTAGTFFTSLATREAQEYGSGYPFPFPADLPYPGIKLGFPALRADSLPTELSEKSLSKLPKKDKRREICWPRWGWMQLYSPELGKQREDGCGCWDGCTGFCSFASIVPDSLRPYGL